MSSFDPALVNLLRSMRSNKRVTALLVAAGFMLLLSTWMAFIDTPAPYPALALAVAFGLGVLIVLLDQRARHQRIADQLAGFNERLGLALHHSTADQSSLAWIVREFPDALMPTTSYTMCPTNLAMLLDLVVRTKPRLVVELGSGASTPLIASCLQRNGIGRLVSFEHDESWAEQCDHYLSRNGLSSIAEVRLAPLRPWGACSDLALDWYDLGEKLEGVADIDLLIIDGPPAGEIEMARFPALATFGPLLAQRALVFLDDGARKGEAAVVKAWREGSPNLTARFHPSSTGYWLLEHRKQKTDEQAPVGSG